MIEISVRSILVTISIVGLLVDSLGAIFVIIPYLPVLQQFSQKFGHHKRIETARRKLFERETDIRRGDDPEFHDIMQVIKENRGNIYENYDVIANNGSLSPGTKMTWGQYNSMMGMDGIFWPVKEPRSDFNWSGIIAVKEEDGVEMAKPIAFQGIVWSWIDDHLENHFLRIGVLLLITGFAIQIFSNLLQMIIPL